MKKIWKKSGGKDKIRKNFYNCENEPLIEDDDQTILKKFPPPPLHLLLGYGNNLWTEAQKVNKSLIDIQKKLYILKADYKGKSKFDGNQITKILNNLDELKEVLTEEQTPFYDGFEN